MKKIYFFWSLLGLLTLQLGWAQTNITGTVLDETGAPLPGATVVVDGTTRGVATDFDGNFSIQANQGDILVFTYVGYAEQRITVGSQDNYTVSLSPDNELEEVVVTSLGIKREAAQLGYAISKVDNEKVTNQPDADIGKLLRGKAAGVNITSSNGLSGSSTNITIRGYTSITGSNQPLFVVDGVPFGSDTNNSEAFFDSGNETSRFLDIDPNSIEEINILKGLSATSLYGNRGRNGVILITTKNTVDHSGTNASVSTSMFWSEPHLPKYQNDYGGGFDQEFGWYFSNWGPSFDTTDAGVFGSWLSRIDENGRILLNHPFRYNGVPAYIVGYEDLAAGEYEYKAYQSVPEFFRTGLFKSVSANLNGGNEDYSYNFQYSKVNDEGFTPGNELEKDNISVGGSLKKGKLKVNASLNFALTDSKSPPVAASRGSGVSGDGSSIFGDLMYTPRNIDLMGLPYTREDGGSLYYRTSNSIQNPRWTVENAKTRNKVDRFFGNVSILYNLKDNLNISYRYGIDTYNENQSYGQNKGGVDGASLGIYRTTYIRNVIKDHNLSINYDVKLTPNLALNAIVGFNSNSIAFERDGLESNKQIAFGTFKHWNFLETSSRNSFNNLNIQREVTENTFGAFADFTLSYEDYLYVNGSVRNDWTSTLETDNNTILYPSGSVSFIATNLFESIKDNEILDYLKIRLGYGSSAGFPSPYRTRNTLSLNGRAFIDNRGDLISSNTTSNFLGNPNLTPELLSEIELGVETQLFDNKVGVNFSYFKKKTKDLITNKDLDPSTGYSSTTINGGDMEISGVELDLNLNLITQFDGFSWNAGIGFYADESLVTKLPEGIDQIIIGNYFTADAKNAAIVGEPFNVLIGDKIRRDSEGNKVINAATGNYIVDTKDVVIGDPNPDFILNLDNTFKYKNFSLNLGIGYRHGGDIFSKTAVTLLSRGVIDFPFDRLGTYILPGVNVDPVTNNSQENTTQIGATDIAFSNWLGTDELEIWDGTTIRLNSISLGYDFNQSFLNRTPFKQVSINITGTNLWYKAVNFPEGVNFDTNTLANGVGNNLGLEYFSGPSSKRFGLSLKATF
jgi:TonB-linked SusC/RagA family outer membrane protein